MEAIIVLVLAVALDLTFGDPPDALHPVAWVGRVIAFLFRGSFRLAPRAQFTYGLVMVLFTIALFVVPAYYLLAYLKGFNLIAYIVVLALLLKATFSIKGLKRAAFRIKHLLEGNKLAEARFELRALVSRDTSKLNEGQMVSATVESVAENSTDSFVTPLFYFLLLGVPGAIAYRVINTCDSMIGFHGKWEYLGKFAARLDDAVNFIPARLAALFVVLSAWLRRRNTAQAWRIMWRDHGNTASPNAGWTMSAMAGALEVKLEKVGYYKLGDNHNSLSAGMIDASWGIAMTAAAVWLSIAILAEVIYIIAA